MLLIDLVLAALGIWLAAGEFLRRFEVTRSPEKIALVMLLAMLLNLDKIKIELQLWQTNVLVFLMFVLSLRWLDKRPVLAGIALAWR